MAGFNSIDELTTALNRQRYLVDEGLGTVVYLSLRLKKPLLVEGEPGVGKTELAKALASAMGAPLIRLQCYEGIDVHHALYDWDYPRQLLQLRAGGTAPLYSEEFLVRRPLLEALAQPGAVLLIDELDRDQLDPATANRTLGTLLKERDDLDRVRREGLDARIDQAGERASQLRTA